jgi:hypothetical protein
MLFLIHLVNIVKENLILKLIVKVMIRTFFYDLTNNVELNDLINKENLMDVNILNKHFSTSSSSNQNYKIIRYNKNILNNIFVSTFGLCRSIVVNKNNKVLSFSPPKSVPTDDFILNYHSLDPNIIAEEFVEGTMINIFWDPDCGLSGNWEISTRNNVSGDTSFYQYPNAKTFRTMFLEALASCNLNLDFLNRELCYSFVLQHPENRIVVPFFKPQLYLVAAYFIIKNENLFVVHPCDLTYFKEKHLFWKETTVKFPEIYDFQNYSELIEKYASMNTSYDKLGVVIHNISTGERCKIRNPVYEQVRQLKGNQPKLQYQYLVLRKEGRVSEYLNYYPETKKIFSQFRDQLHLFTKTLFSNYISCYIKKEKTLIEFPEQYRNHMFKIHEIYINELREKKLFINNTEVIKYVNSLHPSQQMFSINYQMRKRNVDFNTCEPIEQSLT